MPVFKKVKSKPARCPHHEDLNTDLGVIYSVKYLGCQEVNVSMKALGFDDRVLLVTSAIDLVRKMTDESLKKRKPNKRIRHYVSITPDVSQAANANLTITVRNLLLTNRDTGETIVNHSMGDISFESRGNEDAMDFVGYVAKDSYNGRACHVFRCRRDDAYDVVTTIGHAFELGYKNFVLARSFCWKTSLDSSQSSGTYESESLVDTSDFDGERPYKEEHVYCSDLDDQEFDDLVTHPPPDTARINAVAIAKEFSKSLSENERFCGSQPSAMNVPIASGFSKTLSEKEWFHGSLPSAKARALLSFSGDFLVRESARSPGQYVLSGNREGQVHHLILQDPDVPVGQRCTFAFVKSIISKHYHDKTPITFHEEKYGLVLKNPIKP